MHKNVSKQFIGRGAYPVSVVARLLGESTQRVQYWTGTRRNTESVIGRDFPKTNLLTFSELMELQFVRIFRNAGLSLQTIRKLAVKASERFGSKHPFSLKRFDTDGTTVFATLRDTETDRETIQDLEQGQLVFPEVIKPFFRKLEYHGSSEVDRFWPLERKGRVVLDPARRCGHPIDADSGVPTSALAEAVTAGDGQDVYSVAEWFEVPVEAVKAALRFENSLSA